MTFFAASEAPPRPQSMKFPVFTLLAGNLAFSETSSQLTPPPAASHQRTGPRPRIAVRRDQHLRVGACRRGNRRGVRWRKNRSTDALRRLALGRRPPATAQLPPVLDWKERLVCSQCGSREIDMVLPVLSGGA